MDLFEQHEELPEAMQQLTEKYIGQIEAGGCDRYAVCAEFLTEANKLGYTFEYGLDGTPYDLQRVQDRKQPKTASDFSTLDPQDRNTLLAALRFYQDAGMGEPSFRRDSIHNLATDNDNEVSLDEEGIEDLFQRIQTEVSPEGTGDE